MSIIFTIFVIFAVFSILIPLSIPAFAQISSSGVPIDGEWYVGEGLQEDNFFQYELCYFEHKGCTDFELNLRALEESDNWNFEFSVIDDNTVLTDQVELDKKNFRTINPSEELTPYADAYKYSIPWLSHFANSEKPKAFTNPFWGKVGVIGGEIIAPSALETITVPAGTFDTVLITWRSAGSTSKIWVADEFPFPIKAETWLGVTLGNNPLFHKYQLTSTNFGNNEPVGLIIQSNGAGGGDWNDNTTWSGGIVPTPNDKVIIKSGDTITVSFSIYLDFFGSITIEQGGKLIITVTEDPPDDSKSGESSEHFTRPTFGISHETFEKIIDNGFRFNSKQFPITDNHHTDFAEQTVNIGEVNSFSATVYADKGLKVQEFLFGIPEVGQAHLAELGVEVWYNAGEIVQVKAVQKSDVIDSKSIVAIHEKTKCQEQDIEENCDTTRVSMVFREPLADKIMAIKAIDHKNRYQITYLNEGINVAGESLNSMNTMLIPSNTKGEGQILVTQMAKYSPYWIAQDGRVFEKNDFNSFNQINQSFERFKDSGNPYTRLHSEFKKLVAYEQKRATLVFDSSDLVSELPASFAYVYPESHERITDEMRLDMLEQEEIAKQILEESKVQARW